MHVSWSEARSVRLVRSILAFLGFGVMLSFVTVTADDVSRLEGGTGVWGGPWLGVLIAGALAAGIALASVPSGEVYRRGAGGRLTRAWRVRIFLAALVFVLAAAVTFLVVGYGSARILEASGGAMARTDYGGSTIAVAFLVAAHTLLYRLPGEPVEEAASRTMTRPEVRRALLPVLAFGVTAGAMVTAAALALALTGSPVWGPGLVALAGVAVFLAFFVALAAYAAMAMFARRSSRA